jgi:hypothetical protein
MDLRIYLTIYAVIGLYYCSAILVFTAAKPGHPNFRRNMDRSNFIWVSGVCAALVTGFVHFMDRLWFS